MNKKSHNNKLLVVGVFFVLMVVGLVLGGCNALPTTESSTSPKPAEATKYRVTKSTGLYRVASVDASMVEELEVGAILEPVGSKLTCVKLDELGTIYELCQVRNAETGHEGWVLRKWIEEF